jgi:nonribosomal peptide synthetase MxcG
VYNHGPAPPVRLADVYAWVREYGYPVKEMPLALWRTELPRTADVAATTTAFFDSWNTTAAPDLGLGHIRADNARGALDGSGITCPPLDRALMFRYLDTCVTTGVLPAPASGN